MIEKKYTTIEKQIQILKKRNLQIDDEDERILKTYLLEYGYERVITGSNALFKTSNKENCCGNEDKEKYDDNSKASHLMMAFDIDRNISSEIFKFLSKSGEIKINTIIANNVARLLWEKMLQKNGLIFGIDDEGFKEIFPNYEKVLNLKGEEAILKLKEKIRGESIQNNLYYLEIEEAKKDFQKNKIISNQDKVENNIKNNIEKIEKKSNRNKSILYLPIWKIANAWNLSSTLTIFKSMGQKEQNKIIKDVCPKFYELKISSKEFAEILFWIKNIRNMLAHNYSVYKIKYPLNKPNKNFISLIKKLKSQKIISNDINFDSENKTGLMTFVKLLEVFLNITENKIQKEIQKIIDKKFNDKKKNKIFKKNELEQLEKVKEKIQAIINR